MVGIASPWDVVLWVMAFVAALLAAGWAHLRFWVKRLHLDMPYDAVERLRTMDGGTFELRRIGARTALEANDPPVLLVHGICANHRNQDIHPRYSLARFLADAGRDVWLLTLRSGVSRGQARGVPMGFESMVRHDVPCAIRRVLAATGARAVDYVAFSMGGMLLYASLGRSVDPSAVRKVVLVGSPGRVIAPHRVPKLLGRLPRGWVPRLPSRLIARMLAFLSEWFTTPVHRMILNPSNMARGITRTAMVDCVQDVPGELLADFIAWATSDGVVRVDGDDVLAGIRQADQPVLFIAGAGDRVGVASAVHAAYQAWGADIHAPEKRFLVLGREAGAATDYGHADLAMGMSLPTEVFPEIAAFLRG
jgi:polyhydroxyalkanoate synthase